MPGRILLLILSFCIAAACDGQSLVPAAQGSVAFTKPSDMDRTSSLQLSSTILAQTRPVYVGLPRSFSRTSRTYPVLIVLDGEAQFPIAVNVASQLAALGHMPEAIVVGIPNLDDVEGRVHDMTPPGLSVSGSSKNEGGEKFLDFIEKELMPALGKQYRANGMIILEGHSSGGIIATYAAATRPVFRFVLSLDLPAHLGENWIPQRMMKRAQSTEATPLRYVSLESRYGWNDSTWGLLTRAAPKSWRLSRQKLDHESHVSLPFVGLYLGLRTLFEDYQVNSVPESPTTRALTYYRDMEKSWGYPVFPPAGLLRRVIEDLGLEGQARPAADAYRLLVDGYGAPPDSSEWKKLLADLAAMPPLTETVEGLLATAPPRTVDAKRFIGEWRGADWINEEDKHEIRLSLRDSAGALVGEWISFPEPNYRMVQKLTYLKIVSNGLDFGFMNGMRPRGMLLHEGRFDGDVLKGTMRFGGVRLVRPPGMPGPPTVRFELKRVPASP
jgi:pimeloyl-ACP methyl ester carboxylesterase